MVTRRGLQQITDVFDIKRRDVIFPRGQKSSSTYLALTPVSCLSEDTNKMSLTRVTVLISVPKLTYSLAKEKLRTNCNSLQCLAW